ncbi:NAD-dependent succinate-semialdehyde dehydrogenase [Tropicimonas sp. IMCC6043]|uniref:NAD-dependent succinate-semialdehyde dehydrogenase n=1 Tax=Tropicimonas sp. IMCC6043 TaxID=2510645 RepID=UPI00101BF71C|nr:NAD-dependent succinate-semialdehyde dehydrogenase [Tropicimonas sp. IMCC6043]RYH08625.1 NAD-dependent succinate-semialdehyde dehydrogenase [Tropicimonas sp. IMCC6043]
MTDYTTYMQQSNLIGGDWTGADSGKMIEVTNPATGAVIGTVPNCGADETHRAIAAAAEAFRDWSISDLGFRVQLLQDLHDALLDNQESLALLLTTEQGKPLFEAKGEIAISAGYIRWFAEEIRRAKGEIVPAPQAGRRLMVTRHPVGVVGAITPWNFPSSMLARKLGPALAAGCTVVAKPATATPYSGLAWGKLCEEVGFPAGVVNIVTGSARAIGGAIMESPTVRKVTFTGSTKIGKQLIRQSADTVKKVSMELGGNAPFIVFDDADLDAAVEGAMVAKFRNMGQTCVCTNRFYVQSGIHDAFVARLREATAALVVGNGAEEGVQQGPMIDMDAVEKVEEFIADATSKGAKIVEGGKRHGNGGTYFEPTVVTGATSEMQFATEEIFGPLAAVFRFESEEEAIEAANATEFGLAAYAYTRDVGRVFRLDQGLDYGLIGINAGLITTVEAPFGGLKQSGMGKEGGSQGLDDYLETKYLCVAGL